MQPFPQNVPQYNNYVFSQPQNNIMPQSFPSNKPPIIIGQFTQYGNNQITNTKDINEIYAILQNFLNSFNPSHTDNIFKGILYNSFQSTIHSSQYDELKRYYPYQLNEEGGYNCIDFNLWDQATKHNPNSSLFYPIQISSPLQLKNRCKLMEMSQKELLVNFKRIKSRLEQINNNFDFKVEEQLQLIQLKRKKIKQKLLNICNIMNDIAVKKGKAKQNSTLHKELVSRLENIKMKINSTKIMEGIKNISAIPKETYSEINEDKNREVVMKMSKERLIKNKQMINELRNLVSFTCGNLQKNLKIVNGIKSDLEIIKKNGRLNGISGNFNH